MFYVNSKCGFHIVEYLNKYHTGDFSVGTFRFEKQMK